MDSNLLSDVKNKMPLRKYNKNFLREIKNADKKIKIVEGVFILSYLIGLGSTLYYIYNSIRIAFYDKEKIIDENTRSAHRSSLIISLIFLSIPFVTRMILTSFGINF